MKGTDEMRTAIPALALAAMLVVATPVGAVLLPSATADEGDVASGESLSGAVAVHGADLEGEIDERALETRLERAPDDDARAAVLADRRVAVERRVAELRDRRERLRAERRRGERSRTAYRVESASLAAELRQLRGRLEQVERRSRQLPAPVRDAYGLDGASLNRTRTRVDATADDELAAVLTTVLGDREPLVVENDSLALDAADTTLALRDAERTRVEIATVLDLLESESVDESALECGRRNLIGSGDALDRAETAVAAGDDATAEAALVDARVRLRRAHGCLETVGAEWTAPEWNGDYELNESDYDWDDGDGDWNRSDYERDSGDYEWDDDGDWNRSDYDRNHDSHEWNGSDYEREYERSK